MSPVPARDAPPAPPPAPPQPSTTAAQEEERRRFQAVLASMAEGVLLLDGERRVTLVNPAASRLLGLPAQPLGRRLLEVSRLPALHELVERARAGEACEAELDAGPQRRLRARATPLEGSHEVSVVVHDVTELRRLEAIRKDFVANVSHELRTPISVIRANAETLLEGALEDAGLARGFVEALLRNAERLSALISDLLDISRIESGSHKLERRPLALAQAVRQVLDNMAQAAAARGQTLSSQVPEALWALGDEKALGQVLTNLLDNATKYTPDGGHIQVRAACQAGQVRLEVVDDGPGIEPQHRARVFERFYRVDQGRSRAMGGTGLGLSIVKNLIEALGGQVGIEPNQPAGSIFWVTLPEAPP
ncbi:MAG TPA: ATP-binding protein [Myxococcota bacterium]|nr:ATP-binding protein [Myxococcota bacterium]HRY92793.1 ATP-binding protein [Myxococcota bacterium]HSA19831.1 ATP-binding protein [Myxococcota bacterium]